MTPAAHIGKSRPLQLVVRRGADGEHVAAVQRDQGAVRAGEWNLVEEVQIGANAREVRGEVGGLGAHTLDLAVRRAAPQQPPHHVVDARLRLCAVESQLTLGRRTLRRRTGRARRRGGDRLRT